jgi:hypothetical protein
MPDVLWIEIGVLFDTLKDKAKAVVNLKKDFDVNVHPLGIKAKRRWLEATVYMQDEEEEAALDKVAKSVGDKVHGWLDVYVHTRSRMIGKP